MVRAQAASRRRLLPGWLRVFVCSWACLNLLALSAPLAASAEPETYEPPAERLSEPPLPGFAQCVEHVEEGQEVPEGEVSESALAARQVTLLRGELELACQAESQRLDEVIKRLWWLTVEQAESRHLAGRYAEEANEVTQHVVDKLEAPLQVLNVGGEGGPQPVKVEGGVEVTNPPDTEAQLSAVREGTETINQNDWAFLGIAIGSVALFVIWRLVRP